MTPECWWGVAEGVAGGVAGGVAVWSPGQGQGAAGGGCRGPAAEGRDQTRPLHSLPRVLCPAAHHQALSLNH